METRSQSKSKIYEVDIDFDGASKAWLENKKSIGNGSYKYICCAITNNNKKCNRNVYLGEQYCRIHCKKND